MSRPEFHRVGQAQRRPTSECRVPGSEYPGPNGGPALRLSHPTGRREMMRDGLRTLALAALAGLSGLLTARAVGRGGAACTVADACSGCGALARCRRPQAVQARRKAAR